MLLRLACLMLIFPFLGLSGCSLFAPKPVPERYRAKVTYPSFSNPSQYSSVPAPPMPEPPKQETASYQPDGTSFDQWAPAENSKPETEKTEAPGIDVQSLPFAIAVPGDPNVVTLPPGLGSNAEIDVTGIAPGTAVEIPDPNKSGATIKFRVPEPES